MSEDEVMVTGVCAFGALVGWLVFLSRWARLTSLGPRRHPGRHAWLVPVGVGAIVFSVLRTIAASDVRDAPVYLFQYLVMGMSWVVLAAYVFSYLGISLRDDLLERANPAALPASMGLYFGVALAFAGANVGEGPGWWVVVASAFVATLGFLAASMIVSAFGRVHEEVSVERDLGAGVHAAGVFLALGIVAGRGAAGNWEGAGPMVADFFAHAWALAPLAIVGALVARGIARQPRPARVASGLVSATAHVTAALGIVLVLTPPP